jgi:23S rRNA (pseudouridine1915-N3)-methyltransferase
MGSPLVIELLVVGKLKQQFDYLQVGVAEYIKRLTPFCKIIITELPETAIKPGKTDQAIKDDEAKRILQYLPDASVCVALTERGQQLDSRAFAKALASWHPALSGGLNPSPSGGRGREATRMIWVVGGPLGLSELVLQRANWQVSLSALTFPHPLVRLIVLEQLYRAFKILRNEPYHK